MCRAAPALIFTYLDAFSILAATFAVTRAAQERCPTPSHMVPNHLEADFLSYTRRYSSAPKGAMPEPCSEV